jgi:outer membrane protein assembly factor BamB
MELEGERPATSTRILISLLSTMRLITVSVLLAFALPALAENWPQWRGPRLDGTSADSGFPKKMDAGTATWKAELPGSGHASPIVWGDKIFTVAAIAETQERVLLCLDRNSGKLLWQSTVVKAPLEFTHKLNSCASSTPATDGEKIFTAFLDNTETPETKKANDGRKIPGGEVPKGTAVVSAHDFNGKQLWQVKPGLFSSKHGFCASPIVYKDKIIVNCDHDGDGYIVALARSDGHELWRIDRPGKTRSYCVPIIKELAGKMQMVLTGTKCTTSYNPDDGKLIWIMDGPTEQMVASLVWNERAGLLFLTGGFPEHHILGIKPDGVGDVTKTHIAWRTNKGAAYVPSPIAEGDWCLVVSDSGIAHCFEAKTGRIAWEERVKEHHASLVSAEGNVYLINDFGTMRVVKPGDAFALLEQSEIGEKVFASPAMSEGQMFVRGDKTLFCFGARKTGVAGK